MSDAAHRPPFFTPMHVVDIFNGILYYQVELLVMTVVGIVVAYGVTRRYVPVVRRILLQRNLFGIDINKTTAAERAAFGENRYCVLLPEGHKGGKDGQQREKVLAKAVPESIGILAGAVYLSCVLLLVLIIGADMNQLSGPLATIAVLLLLGFVDDVLDVRWRYKILLSAFGVIPLLLSYDGSVSIVVPPLVAQYWRLPAWTTPTTDICFRPYAPSSLHSFFEEEHRHTIGSFLVMLWQYSQSEVTRLTQLAGTLTQGSSGWTTMRDYVGQHYLCRVPNSATGIDGIMVYLGPLYLLYILCICIFCSNSINILAGINGLEVGQSTIVAVACIVYNVLQLRFTSVTTPSGEWSYIERDLSPDHPIRALLLLFPFVGVSLALYAFNKYPAQVFVGDSYTYFAGTVLAVAAVTGVYSKTLMLFFIPQLINFILSLPQLFGIVPCPRHRVPTWSPVTGKLSNSHNYTLLNAILYVTGDLTERRLCQIVLLFQVVCCVFGFVIRYAAAALFFDMVL